MNKKISQFELTNTLYDQDLITVVQSNENKNITVSGLTTSLSNTFSNFIINSPLIATSLIV